MGFLERAIELALKNVTSRGGGPFGAVIARGDQLIAEGQNFVTTHKDPTAHAEIVAIRRACEVLNTFDLKGCSIYASCEPCPMCFSAVYWSNLDAIYFAATKDDAAAAGFRDAHIYKEIATPLDRRLVKHEWVQSANASAPFEAWAVSPDSVRY